MNMAVRLGLVCAGILVFICVAGCFSKSNDLDEAQKTVLASISYFADKPLSFPKPPPNTYHHDYWGPPGGEGINILLIDRRINLIEATKYIGDRTLNLNRQEELIRVVVGLQQHYVIKGSHVERLEKIREITFYLSNYQTSDGRYLILNESPLEYNLYFEDAMRDYLNSSRGRTEYPRLRQTLIDAGMKGLR
jgi:hypothetical protein